MLPVHNQPYSFGDDIMQITTKIVKPGLFVTVMQPPHKKMLGYLVLMIRNEVLPGIIGPDWLVFPDFYTL